MTKLKFLTVAMFMFCSVLSKAQIMKAEIKALGLTCSMCSNAINKQLKSIPEVTNVETDLNTNTFTVSLVDDNNLSPKIFKEKVEKAGFFVGALLCTMKSKNLSNKAFIMLNETKNNVEIVTVQVLDKGYVTDKEYKKLSKSYKSIESFSVNNDEDYHIKVLD
jgi:copper chaperone CopZ